MAKQNINIGVSPNDGTGDPVRTAFSKAKGNFDELYARATGDMNKSTYDADNSGAVDAADKVTGVDAAGNVTYYGKDAAGVIGFHSFSEDKVAEYNDQIAGFDGVLYIDVANFKLYLWDDVNGVYKSTGVDEATIENILVNTTRTYNNAQNASLSTLTDATSLSWNLLTEQGAYLLATSVVGNTRTLPNTVLSGVPVGSYAEILFKQDATGGRKIAFDTGFGDIIGTFDERPNEYTLILVKVVATDKARVILSEWSGGGAISYNRPVKNIAGNVYTCTKEDTKKWLRFTHTGGLVTVTVPDAVFALDDELIGDSSGQDVAFVGGTGFTVKKVASKKAEIPKEGVFGMRFRAVNSAVIFGSLKPI